VAVPLRVDLAAAGPLDLAALQGRLAWGADALTLDSLVPVPAAGMSLTANLATSGTGAVLLNAFAPAGMTVSGPVLVAHFTARPAIGGTRVSFTPTVAGSAAGTNVLTALRTRPLDVCIVPLVRWGDVNNDGTVSVLDAQQLARHSIGLSVLDPVVLVARGDVNADGSSDILDAQQVARFSVGLPVSARVNAATPAVPPIATVHVGPDSIMDLAVGNTRTLVATPRDAAANTLASCVSVSWRSSNPAVATVDDDGVVTAVAQGSATITASSGGRVGTMMLQVPAPLQLAVTVSPGGGTSNTLLSTQPVVTVRDAGGALAAAGGALVTATVVSGGGTLSGTTRVPVVGGIAQFADLAVTGLGAHALQFAATGLTSVTSDPFTITAPSTIRLLVGAAPTQQVAQGAEFTVPLLLDLSGRGEGNLASIAATVTWDPAQAVYVGTAPGTWVDTSGTPATVVANALDAPSGQLRVNGFTPDATHATATLLTLTLRALRAGPAEVAATVTAAGSAQGTAVTVVPRHLAAPTVTPYAPVASIAVMPQAATLLVGATRTFAATLRDSTGNIITGRAIQWQSSDTLRAPVSSAGVVTGRTPGTTIITAFSEGRTGSAVVTVAEVPVASVQVTPASTPLAVGQSLQLQAVTRDATGTILAGRPVTWGSSDTTRVTVSASGLVTGMAPGTATITANSEGQSGAAVVTVTMVPVASVQVTPASPALAVGQTVQLAVAVLDSAGRALGGRTVTWSSGDAAVATVSGAGLVTAVAPGTVTITATSEGKAGVATVTVNAVPVATIVVSPASATLYPGQIRQLEATTLDSSGRTLSGRTVAWSTSSPAVATVSTNGVVTAVGLGSAIITATSEERNAMAVITVNAVPVANVTVTPPSLSLSVGQSTQLSAVVRASDGSVLTGRTVTWSSSTPGVATVSTSGLVTGVAIGSTTITATSEGVTTPVATGVLLPVSGFTLFVGNEHSCAVAAGGTAYCWGNNSSGQLGLGTLGATPELRPRAVSSSTNARIEQFASLAVGGKTGTTCGLLNTGTGFCWGANSWGNIGDGSTTVRQFPYQMTGSLAFARISTGWTHSCALTRAGEAYCWGLNTTGQLGDGTTTQRLQPTKVSGGLTFSRISAGYNSSCGVTTAGALYCWGDDPLGDGTQTPSSVPIQIGAGRTFASVVTGFRNACALTPTGQAWCWGLARGNGQLGNGGNSDLFEPTAVSGLLTFSMLVKGEDHTCGLAGSGTVYCWGSNAYGQLGDGTVVGRSVPTLVSGGATYTIIAAGAFHTCGATTSGTVNCWGRNNSGQLGDGTTVSRLVPTPWNP
jgi:uncharacterized protein YjdB/alpha-tubulin suppressor-like RCC1 family protein